MSGRLTKPWMSSRCLSGSMSGTPLWLRSKCRPLGVIVPSSASSGVRAAPLPVVPGCERMSVRVTLLSYFAGPPYSLNPAPGDFIQGGTSGGSAAAASLVRLISRPLAASRAMLRFRKLRLVSSMSLASPRATLSLPQPRIEQVAQAVAEQVDAEHGGRAGREHEL